MSSNSISQQVIVAVETALGCKAIPVLGAWFALVDEEDYHKLASRRWFLSPSGYAVCNMRDGDKRLHVFMHVSIMNPAIGMQVDHANHVKLDNRKANLRICTEGDNHFNLPLRRDNTSGFKGVYRRRKRWRAQISVKGKHHVLGCFDTAEEAARAYDAKAAELFGDFAHLNFPGDSNGN